MEEMVFVAWGGNQALAKKVGAEIDRLGFRAVIGGGQPRSMYIGSQVFSQIKMTTRAILLVQQKSENDLNLNDNLMFEWGYLVAKLPPDKIHVFLIDMKARDLPSDLAGSWAQEVSTQDRTPEETAAEIAAFFAASCAREERMDKLAVMHSYDWVKQQIALHDTDPSCSDNELAYYVLHCMEAAYYHMDEHAYSDLLCSIHPISMTLDIVSQLVRENILLFRDTENLQKPLTFPQFADRKIFFETPVDLSAYDEELDLWVHMFMSDRMGLLYYFLSKNDEIAEADRATYIKIAIGHHERAIEILNEIIERYPKDRNYTFLYEGYFYRDMVFCYLDLGEISRAKELIARAVNARKQFYLAYKQKFPQDIVLNNRFSQEYYIALAEQAQYTDDAAEKTIIRHTIGSYLVKLEDESLKQHVLITRLKGLLQD